MTEAISDDLRARVASRANERCEYCTLAQAGQEATFHIDHVVPRSSGGLTVASNLALACVGCSLRKAARINAVDPATGGLAPIFSPRLATWGDHFHFEKFAIVGDSPTGRATVAALGMNRPIIVAIREEQALLGRAPRPPDPPQHPGS